ncbi:MAG: AAA family ATPase, partial [Gaiella sp.]
MTTCASCGRESADDARFCAGCGAPLGVSRPREERKIVSVLFADLVGSTSRAERLDPEDVRAILAPFHARLRHELERHGGTVEKFIGDAVVGVFGAPRAHEDDAERAVRAALAIQDAIAELNETDPEWSLEVRVGVNTGEALIDLDAHPERGEAMVSGDVINTAARLQGAAPPGGILVGEQTFRTTDRAIEYAEHPAIEAKGKATPVSVWRAIQPLARFGLDLAGTSRSPLVGRGREVALLGDALARVRSDERPQLVTLVGVPGIGKSRLVGELWRIAEEDADLILWRQGRSLPYGEGVTFWALGEIVKAQAGILETDDADEATQKLRRSVATLIEGDSDAVWVERHLAPLVGIVTGGDSRPSREESFAARRRFLEALAEQGPAVLVFEDLHWADADLLDFVDELADGLDSVPLLLVCRARPELLDRRPGWGGGKPNALTLSLQPLSDDDTARLVSAVIDRSVLPAGTQAELLRRAGGVPLFAEEYARMLEAGERLADLPETLQGLVAARIDGLADDEKALLHDAAVLGKVFWTDALASLAELDQSRLDELLRVLERKEFVRRERRSAVANARQYAFLHAVVRDVAYGQIPRAARVERHRRTAEWIATLPSDRAEDRAETLAHHLGSAIELGALAGAPIDDLRPAAVVALREASDRAWALNSPARSAHFAARGLELGGDSRDPALLFRLGRARFHADDSAASGVTELESAIESFLAAGEREQAALAIASLARYRWTFGQSDDELIKRALALVADAGPNTARGTVLEFVAIRYAISGDGWKALPLAEEALAIARAVGDSTLETAALNTLGVSRASVGQIEQGIADTRAALELALATGSWDVSRCYVNFASLSFELGDLETASRVRLEGIAHAQRSGNGQFVRWLRAEIAIDSFAAGDWDEALGLGETLLARSDGDDERHYLDAPLRLQRAFVAALRDRRLLVEDVDAALELGRQAGDPQLTWPTLTDASLVMATLGRMVEAASLLDEALAARSASGSAYVINSRWSMVGALVWCLLDRGAVSNV